MQGSLKPSWVLREDGSVGLDKAHLEKAEAGKLKHGTGSVALTKQLNLF